MKRILVVYLVFLCQTFTAGSENDTTPTTDDLWLSWKQANNKSYLNASEETRRRDLFGERLNFVNTHNKLNDEGKVSFRLAVYKYADLSRKEWLKMRTGLRILDIKDEEIESSTHISTHQGNSTDENLRSNSTVTTIDYTLTPTNYSPISVYNNYTDQQTTSVPTIKIRRKRKTPKTRKSTTKRQRVTKTPKMKPLKTITGKEEFSWVTQGFVTSVKDQRKCGCCWAFAINAAMESQFLMHQNLSINLSEQQMIDCDLEEFGCGGGDTFAAMRWLKSNPITTETNYPFKAKRATCQTSSSWQSFKISGLTKLVKRNEESLMALVRDHGPAVVAMHATDYFRSYRSGIFVDKKCNFEPNHAILVVGYGAENSQDYWIIKNSWGAQWGEKGYARMARNKNNMCGIASYGSVPTVSIA